MKETIEHPEESLRIIRDMIARSRQTFNRNSFFFLLWGALMFIAGITEHLLLRFAITEFYWIGYPVLGITGGIISMIYAQRMERQAHGETFADVVVGYIWLTYGISLVCLIVTAILVQVNPGIFVLLLTGLPTFLTGFILKHNPLKFGGVIFWICGIASIFATPLYVPLIFSSAILLGYLIPGFTLMQSEQRKNV